MIQLAVFASGSGTNAEEIIRFFREHRLVQVGLVVCNNPEAGVVEVARKYEIPVALVSKKSFYESSALLEILQKHGIDFIVLAGFLWLIPGYLLAQFPDKIINIHPALLPKFGGAGMYGRKVHEAVLQAKENTSGITIHYVNEQYDAGRIIFQATCPVGDNDTPESLAAKVRQLEHRHYPRIIEQLFIKETVNS